MIRELLLLRLLRKLSNVGLHHKLKCFYFFLTFIRNSWKTQSSKELSSTLQLIISVQFFENTYPDKKDLELGAHILWGILHISNCAQLSGASCLSCAQLNDMHVGLLNKIFKKTWKNEYTLLVLIYFYIKLFQNRWHLETKTRYKSCENLRK